jgi:hypothetical protein
MRQFGRSERARPPSSATRILARAGSPTRAATSAICGALDMPTICVSRGANATVDISFAAEAIRVAGGSVTADVIDKKRRGP